MHMCVQLDREADIICTYCAESLINPPLLEVFMYKRLVVGFTVGFGFALWLTGTLFEYMLSPLGNPIIVADMRFDWGSLVTTWKYLGLAWSVGGVLLFYVIRALEKRGSGNDVHSGEGNARKGGSSEVDEQHQNVREGSFGAVKKNLESYRRQLEELESGLTEAGLDINRLKTRIKNRDFSEPKER